MAKYVFLNMPAHGHVNPTLPIVQELVRRGQQVSYYLTEEFRDAVQATGAVFHGYESKMKEIMAMSFDKEGNMSPERVASISQEMAGQMRQVPPGVMDSIRAEQPDVIVYDFMCMWAKQVVQELQVPAITTRATYVSNEHFNLNDEMKRSMHYFPEMRKRMEMMRAMMVEQDKSSTDLFADMLQNVESLNIVIIPKEFQPAAETFDGRYVFVGSSISPRHEAPDFPFNQLDTERPLLYISLGSVAFPQPEFFKVCFEAFAEQPWQVVLSVGRLTDLTTLGPIPDNFLLAPYVPQLDILPRTHLFVTHAGTNSVLESMYYGVPMVLIPQQPEQRLHAQRVVDMGLGVMLEKDAVSALTLREAVERVAHDPAYRERMQQMQHVTRSGGGYQRAADVIMQFVQERAIS